MMFRSTSPEVFVKLALLVYPVALVLVTMGHAPSPGSVPYPDGYRAWTHVKSTVIGPTHKDFARQGGFQHIYANPQAVAGYRTRVFPDGAIVVFEWLEMTENAGAFAEGPRRQVDVMLRDSVRFAQSGGWGFQRFVGDSKTDLAPTPTPQQCFACHDRLKKDGLVLSTYRQ